MFPREIIRNIGQYLNYRDLQTMACVCHNWMIIFRDVTFWQELLELRQEINLPTDLQGCLQRYYQLPDSNGQSVVMLTAIGEIIPVAVVDGVIDIQWTSPYHTIWHYAVVNILTPTSHRSYKAESSISDMILDNYVSLPFRADKYYYDTNNVLRIGNYRIGDRQLIRSIENPLPNFLKLDGRTVAIPGIIKVVANRNTVFFLDKNGALSICNQWRVSRSYLDGNCIINTPPREYLFSYVIDFTIQCDWLVVHYRNHQRIIYRKIGDYVAKATFADEIPLTLVSNNYYYVKDGRLYDRNGIVKLPSSVCHMSSQSFRDMILLVLK